MSNVHYYYDVFESPLGPLYLIFSGKALCGAGFNKPSGTPFKKSGMPADLKDELATYFSGSETEFSQKTEFLSGTDFEKQVWQALKEIPFGETRPYKWIAEQVGSPKAVRAVGRALSKNPIPILYPCHRVIESDGSIGGFSCGVDKKRRLLELEFYAKRQ